MVRYDTYCDTGITIRYVSWYIYYPLIYEMQNCVVEVPIRIYYNIWDNTYHDTIFSLVIRIVGAVYRYIVIHWWIVTSLLPAESIPWCMFGANLLIPAQICDELSCGQSYRSWTSGWTDRRKDTGNDNTPLAWKVKVINHTHFILHVQHLKSNASSSVHVGLITYQFPE